MELTNSDWIRRVAAKKMIKHAGSEDVKTMPEYTRAMEMALEAGKAVLEADPTVGEGPVRAAISEAIREPLQACRSEIIRRDKARRDQEQQGNLERQAALDADEKNQRPDAELASLLPGMPDTVSTLAGQGLSTAHELLNLAEEQGMLNVNGLGLSVEDSQTLVAALYTAKYDISRLSVTRPADPEAVSDKPQPPEQAPDPSPLATPQASEPDPPVDTPEKGAQDPLAADVGSHDAAPADQTPAPQADPPQTGQPEPDGDAASTPDPDKALIADESGLPGRIIEKLAEAGISTRGDLLDHVEKHNTLENINGIGDKSVEAITGYLKRLQQHV